MMDIKFRAWDGKFKKKMIYGPTDNNPQPSWVLVLAQAHDLPLMQYTGIKDKDDVEIYEGDIVNVKQVDDKKKLVYDYGNYEVVWLNAGFTLKNKNGYYTSGDYYNGYELPWGDMYSVFEKIGNIYNGGVESWK